MSAEELIRMRGRSHGNYAITAEVAQSIKDVVRWGADARWTAMPAEVREALDALAMKIARVAAGDWRHEDHWKDIEGYARLALTAARRKGQAAAAAEK